MLDRSPYSNLTDPWSPERVELMKKLWLEDGLSSTEIAKVLGNGITRNAVIGKVHRLKLSRPKSVNDRNRSGKGTLKPRRSADQLNDDSRVRSAIIAERRRENGNKSQPKANAIVHRVASAPPVRIEPIPQGLPEISARKKLIDLGSGECRFCSGDPLTPEHSFCARPVKPGSSWCPEHHRIVFPASL